MKLLAQKALREAVVGLAAMFAIAESLAAQTQTGSVQGRITDEQGSVIAAATVTLRGPAAPLQTAVDTQGTFRFLEVPPGTYSVTVAAPGFATAARDAVLVSVGRVTALELSLPVSAVAEALEVRAESQLIDPGKVATGQTFAREQLTEIPTARDVWSLVQQVPGIQLDTVNVAGNASATLGGPSFSNRGSGNVTYAVDGATITDSFYGFALDRQNGGTGAFFDFSTFDDVEVVSGGSSLQQQTSGVTINVVTKRGTNTLKGSARYLYASANWESDNTPESSSALGLQTNQTRYIREYGAEMGGPLVADRLWLWAAGARQDISLSPSTFVEGETPIPETVTLEPWNAKLNAQLSASNGLSLFFQRSDRLVRSTEVAPDRPPETRKNINVPSNFYKLEDSHVFSPNLFASVFGAYQDASFSSLPVGGLARDMEYYDGQFHGSFFYTTGEQPQWQANLQASSFFETGRARHELKFGFSYRQQEIDSSNGLPGSQNLGDSDSGEASLTRGVRVTFRSEYWAATLGDTLSLGDLTLSAGLRFDLQRSRNLEAESFANTMFAEPCPTCGPDGFPGLPGVAYPGAADWEVRFLDWEPRVSATYGIGPAGETLLRATYARYVDQLGWIPAFVSGVPPVPNGYVYGWQDLNGDHIVQSDEILWGDPRGFFFGIDPQTLPEPPNHIVPGFETPATDEVTFGVDRQLGQDLAVSGTFAYRSTTQLQTVLPTGAGPSTWELGGRATGTATSRNGFTLSFDEPYYLLTLSEPPNGETVENRPGATQRYFGVDVSAVKRLSQNWMLRASVGWSSFRQYLSPDSILNPNNLWGDGGQNDDGGIATAVSQKANVWLNAGWQFSLTGLYQGPWGLTVGANLYGRQGYPKPYKVVVHTADVANSEWSLLIDEMDTDRYPDVYQLDLRLQKELQIGPVTVTPAVELFNVANANTLLNSDPSVGDYFANQGRFEQNDFFDSTIEIQSPRIVRLGIQVAF